MTRGIVPYPHLPEISLENVYSARSVADALALYRPSESKEAHDFAVVKKYLEIKFNRGKSHQYVLNKLDRLEASSSAANGNAFVHVRDYYGFPPSKVFRARTTSNPSVSLYIADAPPPAYAAMAPVVPVPPRVPPPALSLRRASTTSSSTHTRSASERLSSAIGSLTLGTLASPSLLDRSGASSPASIVVNGEHALEMLREYDTAFVIDDSSSMLQEGRWEQACTAVRGVIGQACKHDDDGVDVYFLNAGRRDAEGVRRPADVDRLFHGLQPRGATPTGRTLEKILRDYMRRLEAATAAGHDDAVKPLNIIVITDGAPTDDPESVIVSYAKRLDRGDYPLSQVGIQFFQIGNDRAATAALQELDDELGEAHGIRDMVDTVPYAGELTPETIVKVLLGGVNRRLDRRGTL
ncbi:hypothetical protein CspeluHIS016_0200200 [Cutaneotrichosporon spelunceum]|uniref:VWFA domain-containing protein n=1 Tax=Cutaneotrichosporon spelunceum TaxID=1672016 RepID=A0AAD3TQT6_9TREE|nr:hypothetical protein CspeluHIS016_0200200 [Cutaneotrichosporon spelunceum]